MNPPTGRPTSRLTAWTWAGLCGISMPHMFKQLV